ncbi:MAG: hypothetical protein K1X81_12290 [Bacteroidia bacterium]|nr:hypothetical protein [Bacteroidia bacterium]
MHKKIFSSILLFSSLLVLAQPVAMKSFFSRGGYFSLSYPGNWELSSQQIPGIYFQAFSPKEGPNDRYRESVNVVIEDLNGKQVSEQQYIEATKKNLLFNVKDYRLIKSGEIMLGGYKAYEILYTGKLNMYNLKFRAVIVFFEKRAFVMTYSSDLISYDKFYPETNKIMSSIRLLHVAAPVVKPDSSKTTKAVAPKPKTPVKK